MKTFKGTPGPWYLKDGTHLNDDGTGFIGTFDIINMEHYEDGVISIACAHPYGPKKNGGFPTREEAKANASLMAAAPDLLEVLCLALPYIEGAYECAFPDGDHNENVLNAVKAAIEKATA